MRFAATHKTVSYLMVSVAFLMLVLTGEVSPLLAAITGFGLVASYFFDPQNHPFLQSRIYAVLWYLVVLLSPLIILPDASRGDTVWDSATRFLCIFLCARLWRRRSNADYLQAYLVSFLMLLVASLVGASVVYALCLLLYSVFATWTLTLFHLRREMEENYLLKHLPGRHGQAAESERVEVERILNSRRVVGNSFLITTGGLSVVLFLIAGLLFLLLPRIGVSLDLPLRRRGLLLTGFAEQIQLGGHGVLRENPRVVMRVELPGAPPVTGLRFRGVAFDHYQEGRWSRSQISAQPAVPMGGSPSGVAHVGAERPLAQYLGYHLYDAVTDLDKTVASLRSARRSEIFLEPLETSVLFVPVLGRPLAVSLPPSWYFNTPWPLLIGPEDELVVRSRLGSLHYTVYSTPLPPDPTHVEAAPPPAELMPYLQLPANLPPRIAALAHSLTQDQVRPHDKVMALVRYLQTHYSYTTQLTKDPGREPLDVFLFERKRGHCEYFASALAILLRTLDIPSRSVNGYMGGEWNEYGNYLVVRQQHAHSWVEAYLPDVGWITYDPTPLAGLPLSRGGILGKARKLSDSLEMSWNKYILEYDVRTQQRLSDRLRLFIWPVKKSSPTLLRGGRWLVYGVGAGLLAFLLGFSALHLIRLRLHRRQPEVKLQLETQGLLRRALVVLRRRGFIQRPGETLRQLAERVEGSGDSSGPIFAELVQHYYAHRFGLESIDVGTVLRLTRSMAKEPRLPRAPKPQVAEGQQSR